MHLHATRYADAYRYPPPGMVGPRA